MPKEVERRIAVLPAHATALTKHTMNGQAMKHARYIVTEEHPEDAYLFRYSDDWDFAGDTWHVNLEEALGQAEYEFSVAQLEWRVSSEAQLIGLTNRNQA